MTCDKAILQEVLDGAHPAKLMYAFTFKDTPEGGSYWSRHVLAGVLSEDACDKLKAMLKLCVDEE